MLGRRVGPVQGGELEGGAELVDDGRVFRDAEAVRRVDGIEVADVVDVFDGFDDENHGDQATKVIKLFWP